MQMTEDFLLIDTSAWIWALRPDGMPTIQSRGNQVLAERKGAMTPLILLEILGGAQDEKDYTELSEELSALHPFSVSRAIWTRSYRTAFDLRKQGITILATDVLIATVAQENRVTPPHADRHFDLIAEKMDLRVESWVKAAVARKGRRPEKRRG